MLVLQGGRGPVRRGTGEERLVIEIVSLLIFVGGGGRGKD
jgi:hypothetical protein